MWSKSEVLLAVHFFVSLLRRERQRKVRRHLCVNIFLQDHLPREFLLSVPRLDSKPERGIADLPHVTLVPQGCLFPHGAADGVGVYNKDVHLLGISAWVQGPS